MRITETHSTDLYFITKIRGLEPKEASECLVVSESEGIQYSQLKEKEIKKIILKVCATGIKY